MPTISRRADGVYQLKIRRGPLKPRYVTVHGTEAEAQQTARTLHAVDSLLPMRPETPLGDWLRRFIAGQRNITEQTRRTYRHVIECCIDRPSAGWNIGDIPVNQIQPIHAGYFVNHVMDSLRQSPATLRKAFGLIRRGLEAAREAGMIAGPNPFPAKGLPTPRPTHEIPSREQVMRIQDVPDDPDGTNRTRLLLTLAAHTGARVGELCALTWHKIDMRAMPPTMRIDAAIERATDDAKQPKTEAGNRTVALPSIVMPELRRGLELALQRREPGQTAQEMPVLHGAYDGRTFWRPDAAGTTGRRAMKRAGIPGSVHSLRHAHATMLLALGKITPQALRQHLGHADVRTTIAIYTHAIQRDDADIANVVDLLMMEPEAGKGRAGR